LSEKFSAEIEFHNIDPWSRGTGSSADSSDGTKGLERAQERRLEVYIPTPDECKNIYFFSLKNIFLNPLFFQYTQ
jgi:hypothetical protein